MHVCCDLKMMSKFYITFLVFCCKLIIVIIAGQQSFPPSTKVPVTVQPNGKASTPEQVPTVTPSTNCNSVTQFGGTVQVIYVLVISSETHDFLNIVNLIKTGPSQCFANSGSDVELVTRISHTGPVYSYSSWQSKLNIEFKQISTDDVASDNYMTLVNAVSLAAAEIRNAYPKAAIIVLSDFCTKCTPDPENTYCKACRNLDTFSPVILSKIRRPGLPIIFLSLEDSAPNQQTTTTTTMPANFELFVLPKLPDTKFGTQAPTRLTSCTQTASIANLYKNGTLYTMLFPCKQPPADTINTVAIVLGVVGFVVLLLISCMFFCYMGRRQHWRERIKKMRRRNEHMPRSDMHLHHEMNDPKVLSHIENEIKEKHKRKRKSTERYKDLHQMTEAASDRESLHGDPWELPRGRLTVYYNEKLGSGAFCNVYKGYIIGRAPVTEIEHIMLASKKFEDCEAAVKMLPDYADYMAKSDFQQEINFMKQLGYHPHLMSLLACVTIDSPLCLVTECCAKGDLLKLVRTKKAEILGAFLCSKGCIHRDVAARNILVTDSNTAKIGDFGLCRNIDQSVYTTRGGRLPIKWMSYESLIHYEYTTQSDVWSFGVLLFEIFSFGEVPYPTIQPADMIDHLKSGNRMGRPEQCADDMYELMTSCWSENPQRRPTFEQLRERLASILENTTEQYGYINFSESSDQTAREDNDSVT